MKIMEDVDLNALSFGRQRQSSIFSSNSLDLKDVFLSSAAGDVQRKGSNSPENNLLSYSPDIIKRSSIIDDLLDLNDDWAIKQAQKVPINEGLHQQKNPSSNNDSWPRLSITTSKSIDNRSIKENRSVKLGEKSNSLSSYPSSNNGNPTEALKKLINHAPLVLPTKLSAQYSAPPPLERPKLQLSKNIPKVYDNFANNNLNDLDKANVNNDRENSDFGEEEDDVFLQYSANESAKKRRDDYRKLTSSSAGLSGAKFVNSLKKVRFAMTSSTAGKNDGEDCVKFGGLSKSDDDSELETSEMRVGGDKSGDKFLLKTMPRRGCCPCQRAIAWLVYLLVINFCMITIVLLFLYIPETFRRIVNGPFFGKNRKSISACHDIGFSYVDNITLPNIYPTSSVKVFGDRSSKSILFGYGSLNLPCENRKTCQHRGGVICLKISGAKSFAEKWRLLTVNEVTSINCYHDVDSDGISDCIIGGKSGILKLINGRNGTIMWEFLTIAGSNRRVLEPQLVNDLDADGFADILVTVDTEIEDKYVHYFYCSGEPTQCAFMRLFSDAGIRKNGLAIIIKYMLWPHGDSGVDEVVLSAGTLRMTGGLNVFSLRALERGLFEKNQVLLSNGSVLSKPLVIDLDLDGYTDLVACSLNGEVLAFSGRFPHKIMWRYMKQNAQCTSAIVRGSFHNSTIKPCLAVTFSIGPKNSLAYREIEVVIINGTDGLPLKIVAKSSTAPTDLKLTDLKMLGFGNDLLTGWTFGCRADSSNNGLPAAFFNPNWSPLNVAELDSVDFCRLSTNPESSRTNDLFVANINGQWSLPQGVGGKIFSVGQDLKNWLIQNGLESRNMQIQVTGLMSLNISHAGRDTDVIFATHHKSLSTEYVLYPEECFKIDKGYILPSGSQSELCKKFSSSLRDDVRGTSYRIDNSYSFYGAGYLTLHRIRLTCKCDPDRLNGGICATFV